MSRERRAPVRMFDVQGNCVDVSLNCVESRLVAGWRLADPADEERFAVFVDPTGALRVQPRERWSDLAMAGWTIAKREDVRRG